MHPEIARARAEQVRLAALLQTGHPDRYGIRLAITDWFWEELLIDAELTLSDTLTVGALARQSGRERPQEALRRNLCQPGRGNRYFSQEEVPKGSRQHWTGGRNIDG
jgi:hypothetical protein